MSHGKLLLPSAETSDGVLLQPLEKELATLQSLRPAELDLVVAVDT